MAETDFEKERRSLRELEGKNIAHYRVVLTALIRSRMENSRTLTILSSAAIGLLALILLTGKVHDGWKLLIAILGLIGFFMSLVRSLGILERNADILSDTVSAGSQESLLLEGGGCECKKFFVFGCVCLIALSLNYGFEARGSKICLFGKKDCCSQKQIMGQAGTQKESSTTRGTSAMNTQSTQGNASAKGPALQAMSSPSTYQTTTTSNATKDALKVSTGTDSAQSSTKIGGNAGNFKGGKIY